MPEIDSVLRGPAAKGWSIVLANVFPGGLGALIRFLLLTPVLGAAFLVAIALDHFIQRLYARAQTQPALPQRGAFLAQTLHCHTLLFDGLIEAIEKDAVILQARGVQTRAAGELLGVFLAVAQQLLQLLLGGLHPSLAFAEVLRGVALAIRGNVHHRLHAFAARHGLATHSAARRRRGGF